MKNLFAPLLSAPWLNGLVPGRMLRPMRKMPWYRHPWLMSARWVPAVLAAPLLGFIAWKGIPKIRTKLSKT
jgi:hypothetical protein